MAIELQLTQGKMALIDEEDSLLAKYKWYAHFAGAQKQYVYAARMIATGKYQQKRLYLHHAVLGEGKRVDHKNGNTLDCRRSNLREATKAQNNRNCRLRVDSTSGFKGVKFSKDGVRAKRWESVIGGGTGGKQTSLGRFFTPEEAARAYDKEALKRFGEFARLNFAVEGGGLSLSQSE